MTSAAAGSWPAGWRRPPRSVPPAAWRRAAGTTTSPPPMPGTGRMGPQYLPFRGAHQTGITHPGNEQGLLAAFTVTAADRSELRETFADLTTEIDRLMSGSPYDDRDPAYPPVYTGAVGNPPPAADLSVVVSVGASLFDERYGLADQRPRSLEKMPFLANDRLDAARSHGDLLLSITSTHEDINLFALRQLHRATRGTLALHWMLGGYNRRIEASPEGGAGKAQPARVHRRHRQPRPRRRRGHGPFRVDPTRRRRARLDRRGHVPRRARDPDAGGVLGPHAPVRAGGPDRAAQGLRRPVRRGGRDRRARLLRRRRRP